MGIAKFSLLLARNNNYRNQLLKSLYCRTPNGSLTLFRTTTTRTLSTNAAEQQFPPNKEEGLGARLSFVVEELENMQKQKAEKIAAHEKLRLWRGKNTNIINNKNNIEGFDNVEGSVEKSLAVAGQGFETQGGQGQHLECDVITVKGEIAHPWPEWLDLMERLAQQRYFDKRRLNEDDDDIVEKLSGGECTSISSRDDENLAVLDGDFDVFKDLVSVRKACLDFGRDRYDILRSLPRKDIQILVGFGCPNLDKKMVLSGKRLRAYVHLDEGDVCSSCKLRNSCSTAFIGPREEESEACTMDVMRILMIYGMDPLINSAENKLHKRKTVKTAIRRLLKEVVRLSAVPINPNFPKPVFKRPPPKVKEPQPPPRKRVGRDDIEMKKGDWLCTKCDFLNFAKNNLCLQCEAQRPRRLLNPGEWECPGCNFLNYRRNMTCYNCDHKRPEDEYTKNLGQGRDDNNSQQSRHPNGRLEHTLSMISSSKAWNDDFDDDESDGADVATFEYGDSSKITEGPMMNVEKRGRKDGFFDDNSFDFDDSPMHGRERMKGQNKIEGWKTGDTGRDSEMDMRPMSPNDRVKAFNDFGDFEEDEDEDAGNSSLSKTQSSRSYERGNMLSTSSRRNESDYDSDKRMVGYQRKGSESYRRPLQRGRSKEAYDSFDEDSSESESDDDETEQRNGNRGKTTGRRAEGAWNKKDKSDSFERGYNSNGRLGGYQRKGSESFRRPLQRGSSKEGYDSFDEDSSEPESDDDGTEWTKGNKDRSMRRRGGGAQNRKGKSDSFGADSYESDDEVPHLSTKNWRRGKDARFTGRDTSLSSRGRNGFKDEYDFEKDQSGKRNHGVVNGRKETDGNWNGQGQTDSMRGRQDNSGRGDKLFGPRRGGRVQCNSDFEDEPGNRPKYGRSNGSMGSGGTQNGRSRNRNDSSERSPRAGKGASFRSRGGRMQNNHDFREPYFEDEPGNRPKYGRSNGYMGSEGTQNSRSRNTNDSSERSPRAGRGASFRSRGGRMQTNHNFH